MNDVNSWHDLGFDPYMSRAIASTTNKLSQTQSKNLIPVGGISGKKLEYPLNNVVIDSGRVTVPYLSLTNFINDDDASITYSGTWAQEPVGVLLGATRTVSNTVSDTFTIKFSGTSIGLVLEKTASQGKMTITIDGVSKGTADLYTASLLSRSVAYQTSSLADTEHTLIGTVATKNASATDNIVGLQGYTLFPNEGIKLEQLSCDLYVYGVVVETDGNGYYTSAVSTPSGYCTYHLVSARPSVAEMADATQTDPKVVVGTNSFYLYNGAATTEYTIFITMLISKI